MKGVCFEEVGKVSLRQIDDPRIESPRDVIVKVHMSGLCGSDLHPFFGRESGLEPGTVMGHELVGEVVEAGDDVTRFRRGDRVFAPFSTNCGSCYYCQRGLTSRCVQSQLFGWRSGGAGLHGCQSSHVRIPLAEGSLMKAPDALTDESALLLGDNFSTGFYCAEMAGFGSVREPDDVCCVIGCGTVGQLAILAAQSLGAGKIVAVDPLPARRDAVAESGNVVVAGPDEAESIVRQMTDGRGADAVMELVGLPDAQTLAYRLIRPGGTMSVIGCHCTPDFSFSPVDAYDKNLTYRTGRCPARHYMDKLTGRVAGGEFSLDRFITHRFAPDQCEQAYDVFSNRRDGCIKAVFQW